MVFEMLQEGVGMRDGLCGDCLNGVRERGWGGDGVLSVSSVWG